MAEENRWRSFLIGLILGTIIGSVLASLVSDRARRLRDRGIDLGSRAAELAALARVSSDEFMAKFKEIIGKAIEQGRQAATRTRADLEERYKRQSEK